jgi:glycosyltransferase involved in cell wall biosynthesis
MKKNRNVVSVLIATYNHGKYIEEALYSVLSNSENLLNLNIKDIKIEVIVIDDGSTDNTKSVVTKFKSYNNDYFEVKYFYQENQGQSAAYELGLKHITGEIVLLLDSDDRFLPDKVRKVLSIFRDHDDVGMVAHPLFVIDKDGRRTGETRPKAARISHGDIREIVKKFGRNVAPATSGLAFRTELFKKIHPNPLKGISCAADSYLSFAASLNKPVYSISEPLSEYRQHSEGQYFKRMTTLDGLEKTYLIQYRIVSHFGLEKTLEKNSFFSRNIFALNKMKKPMSKWFYYLIKLNLALIKDPFLPFNKKILLIFYWNFVGFLPRKYFWRFWILFQKVQTGYKK